MCHLYFIDFPRLLTKLIKQLVWLVIFIAPSIFALSVQLEPTQISEGDTTRLIIQSTDPDIDFNKINLTPLLVDFTIENRSSSFNIQQYNGKTVKASRLELELLPRRTGKIEIPALDINGQISDKLNLIVLKRDNNYNAKSNVPHDVFLQMSAKPENPYIGQQITISVKLFHKIRIVNGNLAEPEAENVDVYRIGNDITYRKTVNGQQYEVLERTFAMFANNSGTLPVLPVTFRGQISDSTERNNSIFSSMLRQVKQIRRKSNELTLSVRDIPDEYTGKYWLPANNIAINEEWTNDSVSFIVGDSLSRVIRIIANGLPAEALPENIMSTRLKDLKIYPDKVNRINQDSGKILFGKLEQNYAIIFSSAGEVVLPEIVIDWWDIDEEKQKRTFLAKKLFNVENDSTSTVANDSSPSLPDDIVKDPSLQTHSSVNSTSPWQWVSILLFLIVLLTNLLWWHYLKQKKSTSLDTQVKQPDWDNQQLKTACRENNATNARKQLILWANWLWPNSTISGLHQIKQLIDDQDFKNEIDKLNLSLFAKEVLNWQGNRLWESFKRFKIRSNKPSKNKKVQLASLFPQDVSQ